MVLPAAVRSVLACVLTAAVAPAARAAATEEGTKIAVLDIRATGTDEATARTLSEILTVEVGRFPRTQVIASNEIEAMLDVEQRRQILGCDENVACFAGIAGSMGVDKLCTGSLGRVDGTSVLTLRVIDVRKSRVESRLYETDAQPSAFIGKMPSLVARLFPGSAAGAAAATQGDSAAAVPAVAAAPAPRAPLPEAALQPSPGGSVFGKPWFWAVAGAVPLTLGLGIAAATENSPRLVGSLTIAGLALGSWSAGLCVYRAIRGGGSDERPVEVVHPAEPGGSAGGAENSSPAGPSDR